MIWFIEWMNEQYLHISMTICINLVGILLPWIHRIFVAGSTCQWIDLFTFVFGIILGIFIFILGCCRFWRFRLFNRFCHGYGRLLLGLVSIRRFLRYSMFVILSRMLLLYNSTILTQDGWCSIFSWIFAVPGCCSTRSFYISCWRFSSASKIL